LCGIALVNTVSGESMTPPLKTPSLVLDHITVAAHSLSEGVAYVESALGVHVPAGGKHARFGTHNHLLRMGEALFLEIIAIDPDAPAPTHPRWFALDTFGVTKPRLSTWVVRTNDIVTALASGPQGSGCATKVTRDSRSWLISVPEDGSMPFSGAYPTLIEWSEGAHPASQMPDLGCSLDRLMIEHPDADKINDYLHTQLSDPRIRIETGENIRLSALVNTPGGLRALGGGLGSTPSALANSH